MPWVHALKIDDLVLGEQRVRKSDTQKVGCARRK
jgi:hypothetical protein